jgi:sec-independent protein translocase protein TatA
MAALTPWHLGLILLGFMVFFGYRKLPDASRSFGRSLRVLKGEVRALKTDGAEPAAEPAAPPVDAAVLEAEARAAEARAAALRDRADQEAAASFR